MAARLGRAEPRRLEGNGHASGRAASPPVVVAYLSAPYAAAIDARDDHARLVRGTRRARLVWQLTIGYFALRRVGDNTRVYRTLRMPVCRVTGTRRAMPAPTGDPSARDRCVPVRTTGLQHQRRGRARRGRHHRRSAIRPCVDVPDPPPRADHVQRRRSPGPAKSNWSAQSAGTKRGNISTGL
jgi:hypothetical protein